MKQFRVTRPELYIDFNCPGHADVKARQGHYYNVETARDAVIAASKDFDDNYFDVQQWDDATLEGGKVETFCRAISS